MNPFQRFQELFDYDLWANRMAIASVEPVAQKSERAMKVLGHLFGAQRVWLSRFRNPEPPNAQPWPDLNCAEALAAAEELHRDLQTMLGSFAPERIEQDLVYRTTKGAEFRTPIRDLLTHLLMHSAYHRGQVAMAVRDAGGTPAATDYVVYVRQVKKA